MEKDEKYKLTNCLLVRTNLIDCDKHISCKLRTLLEEIFYEFVFARLFQVHNKFSGIASQVRKAYLVIFTYLVTR